MSNKILEQASAFVDGELGSAEARLFLARLERDEALRKAIGRHELVGEAMRGALPPQRRDFAAGVMAAIEGIDHADLDRKPASALPRKVMEFARPAAGLAVAASVAMLAIVTLQGPAGVTDADAPVEVVPVAAGVASTPVVPARQVDFSNVRSPELQNQLRGYLMNHNEHAGNSRLRGVMPYVQIAAQDSRPVAEEADTQQARNGGTLPNDPQF